MNEHKMSERKACEAAGISRSVQRYEPRKKDDGELRSRMRALAVEYPRSGHRSLHEMLKKEGLVINRKRSYRIYREEGLSVRVKKKGKIRSERVRLETPAFAGERWSMDFVSDQLSGGRRFRVLNVIDDYTRECVLQVVDTSIGGARLARELLHLGRRLPRRIVCDNGPEFTSKAMHAWSKETGVELHFIRPGNPVDNAFVESFNGRFRDECLNQQWFESIGEAAILIEKWRVHYNTRRPHSSLGYDSPEAFAKKVA